MSSPLAIAAVTLALRHLLVRGLDEANIVAATGSPVTVTTEPPDRIGLDSALPAPHLNLFLYQVAVNTARPSPGLPSRPEPGRPFAGAPLALDLRYLLTAYGAEELQAEILLGYATQVLHGRPVLDRQALDEALAGRGPEMAALPPGARALSASDLGAQVDRITVTLSALSTEEMSRLWLALGAHYRLSVAYEVSAVIVGSQHPA